MRSPKTLIDVKQTGGAVAAHILDTPMIWMTQKSSGSFKFDWTPVWLIT